LAVLYPMPSHVPILGAVCSGLMVAVITLMAMRMRNRQPALIAGWLWFLGTLVPVIGLIQVGEQSMADRYTYLPLIGVFVAVVWGLADWQAARAVQRPVKCIGVGLALAGFAWVTSQQLSYWHDGTTLFGRAVHCTTGNPIAHNNLGTALSANGRTPEAMREFAEAIRLEPNYPQAHFNLAMDLGEEGKTTEAIHHLQAVLRVSPKEAEAHNNLGIMLAREGQLQEAVDQFTTAIALKPGYLKAHLNLAMALCKQGKTAEAIARYRVALRLEPQSPEPLDKLAWLMATTEDARFRDGTGAVQLAERAAELSRHPVPGYLDTLAAAYAEAGRFKEAVAAGQKALQLAASVGVKELHSQIENRLQLYLDGKPYHERESRP
jgi:Flp pilus assembly protein TadD